MEREEYNFVTGKGLSVVVKWVDKAKEYRAFKRLKSGELLDMKLGSAIPDSLCKYVKEKY